MLLVIQLLGLVFWVRAPLTANDSVTIALDYLVVITEMFNVIIRSALFFFYFFCFTENFTWLGNHTNNNSGAGVNEIVL